MNPDGIGACPPGVSAGRPGLIATGPSSSKQGSSSQGSSSQASSSQGSSKQGSSSQASSSQAYTKQLTSEQRAAGSSPEHVELLRHALAAYRSVVSDPQTHAPEVLRLTAQARRLGAWEPLILLLRAQAWARRSQFALQDAKSNLDEAARLARRHQLVERLHEVLVTRAAVHTEQGKIQAAQRDLTAAGKLNTVHRNTGQVEMALQQAVLNQNLGRLSPAAAIYESILNTPDAAVDIRAKSANNLAIIESQLGRLDLAQQHAAMAANWAIEVGPALEALLATTRGWITIQTGRLTESIEIFDAAADRYTAVGLPLGEHYLEYADALIDLRLLPEALQVSRRAVAEFELNGADLMAAEGQYRVAVLALLNANTVAAVTAATAAYAGFLRQRRPTWAARTALVLVEAELQLGTCTQRTLGLARRAAKTLEKVGIAAHAVDAHLVAGRVSQAIGGDGEDHLKRATQMATGTTVLVRLKGHIAAALRQGVDDREILKSCRTGLTDLAHHRASLASMELRVRASAHGAELGHIGLGVLLQSGSPGQVFSWLERTRAAALVAVESTADLGVEEMLGALRTVQADLVAARADRQDADRSEEGAGTAEPTELLARQAALESQIRRATWRRSPESGGPHLTPPSSAELRGLLDGQVLVEYGVHGGAIFAAVLAPRQTRIVPLGKLSDVLKVSAQLHFALQMLLQPSLSPPRFKAAQLRAEMAIAALTKLLLEPITISADTPVVVVPTGAMQRIPWSALHPGPITVAPSAALWQATRTRTTATTDEILLVAGPDLPGATAEITALAALHPHATVLMPPASTAEAVLNALPQAGLAHLSCHLNLRSDNPSFSALQLADGFLTMHELEVRGIAPHRMVLAACNSASDVSYAGNEVLGFVSSLISHGTSGVVASIVVVPDAAAVPLMKALHQQVLTGKTLCEALHVARQSTDRRDPLEFVTWCAFNSYGAA